MVQKSARRPRGRPRAYDPDDALVRATKSFWRGGFAGTSLDELSNAMDMNRPSLYGAFGDKRALYLAAMDRYVDVSRTQMGEVLSPDVPLADALQRVYDLALVLYFSDSKAPLGCFLVGTAATEAARDPKVRKKLGAGLRAFAERFEARFRAAREKGELPRDADPALLAEMAGAVLHSIALRARAGDSREQLAAFSRQAVKLLVGG